MVQAFCQVCKCVTSHVEVSGANHKKSLECAHCLEVGHPKPVKAFSPEWEKQLALMATAKPLSWQGFVTAK